MNCTIWTHCAHFSPRLRLHIELISTQGAILRLISAPTHAAHFTIQKESSRKECRYAEEVIKPGLDSGFWTGLRVVNMMFAPNIARHAALGHRYGWENLCNEAFGVEMMSAS